MTDQEEILNKIEFTKYQICFGQIPNIDIIVSQPRQDLEDFRGFGTGRE